MKFALTYTACAAIILATSCTRTNNDAIITDVVLDAAVVDSVDTFGNEFLNNINAYSFYDYSKIKLLIYTEYLLVNNLNFDLIPKAYAKKDIHDFNYNLIEKVENIDIITINDYNASYPAGTSIKQILRGINNTTVDDMVDQINKRSNYGMYIGSFSIKEAPSDSQNIQLKVIFTLENESKIASDVLNFKAY